MPFLPPNQQHQSTEGNTKQYIQIQYTIAFCSGSQHPAWKRQQMTNDIMATTYKMTKRGVGANKYIIKLEHTGNSKRLQEERSD